MAFGRRIIQRARQGQWVRSAWEFLADRGHVEPPTPEEPEGRVVPKGVLRSRTIVSALIGLSAWVLLQAGVSGDTIEPILNAIEALGFGGAGVFRVLATMPVRGGGHGRA